MNNNASNYLYQWYVKITFIYNYFVFIRCFLKSIVSTAWDVKYFKHICCSKSSKHFLCICSKLLSLLKKNCNISTDEGFVAWKNTETPCKKKKYLQAQCFGSAHFAWMRIWLWNFLDNKPDNLRKKKPSRVIWIIHVST